MLKDRGLGFDALRYVVLDMSFELGGRAWVACSRALGRSEWGIDSPSATNQSWDETNINQPNEKAMINPESPAEMGFQQDSFGHLMMPLPVRPMVFGHGRSHKLF